MSHTAGNTEINFSLLRSKIRELHPVHRSSLEALLRHFSRVASYSDTNGVTVNAFTSRFSYAFLRGNVLQGCVYIKARCVDLL